LGVSIQFNSQQSASYCRSCLLRGGGIYTGHYGSGIEDYLTVFSQLTYILQFSCNISFVILIVVEQEHTSPPQAALLFSLSSVVCAAVGYVALDEELSGFELVGCVLMTVAAVLPGLVGTHYNISSCWDGWEELDVFRSMEISSSNSSSGLGTNSMYSSSSSNFVDATTEDDDEELDSPKSRLLSTHSFAPTSSNSIGWQRWAAVSSRSLFARGWALLLHPAALVAGGSSLSLADVEPSASSRLLS